MTTPNTPTPNSWFNANTQRTLVFLFTCLLGHIIESWLKIDYTWGLSIGLALSYPYYQPELLGPYLLRMAALASIFGLEIAAVNRTGVTDFLIRQYREKYLDTQIITAVCVVLLLTPVIDVIVEYAVQPFLEKRIPPLGMKIVAATIFGIFIAILNSFGAITFVVTQCRELDLDAHLITAICVMFVLSPLNDVAGNLLAKLFHKNSDQ